MYRQLDDETTSSLKRTSKICKYISYALKIIFVLVCGYWIFATGAMAYSLAAPEIQELSSTVSLLKLGSYLLYGTVIAAVLFIVLKFFSEVGRGKSPFVMLQVRRLRLIALLLVAYSLLDTFIVSNTAVMQFGGMDLGYVSTTGNTILALSFGPLVIAAIVYAFSFVFKYGVLLQELSDETL